MIRTLTAQPRLLGCNIILINIKILPAQYFVEPDNSEIFKFSK